MIWVALGLTAETAVFMLAGFAWFLSRGYTFAEAGAGAVVTVFMALSLIHQGSLFDWITAARFYSGTGRPGSHFSFLASVGCRTCIQKLASATRLVRQEIFAGLDHRGRMDGDGGSGGGGMVVDGSPADRPSVEQTDDRFGIRWSCSHGGHRSAIPPLNATALFYHTARFGLGPNACGFGLLAHMAVGFSTYALARRYAWPPMALDRYPDGV